MSMYRVVVKVIVAGVGGEVGGVVVGVKVSTYRTKNNKCRSFPPAPPLDTYTHTHVLEFVSVA